ncbi:MAG: twin-arginine translocase subunit TatC [Polyangiaceae bacterium]|nr:twin-arginine translocase subunit TatC [Polyangiaceae bacterium]
MSRADRARADPPAPDEPGTMTFWEHLEELRARIVKMLLAFALGAGVAWVFREELLLLVTQPFLDAWAKSDLSTKASLHFPAPTSLFVAYLKLAFLGGGLLAFPLMLWQVWAFVAPGLYTKEKRLAVPFVLASCALFAGGGLFGFKLAFPLAFQFLLGMGGPVAGSSFEVTPTVMIQDYLDFVLQMLLAFGIAFELPVLIFFLALAGVVDHVKLIRFFRYFVVVAFVVSAIATPPDVTSQLLLAIPLCVLYALGVGVAWLVTRSRRVADKRADRLGED